MRFRFTIRDLLWLTAVIALTICLWLEHRRQTTISNIPAKMVDDIVAKDDVIARLRQQIEILKSTVVYPDSKNQLTTAGIQNQIQMLEDHISRRESELRPAISRRMLDEFQKWIESRPTIPPGIVRAGSFR